MAKFIITILSTIFPQLLLGDSFIRADITEDIVVSFRESMGNKRGTKVSSPLDITPRGAHFIPFFNVKRFLSRSIPKRYLHKSCQNNQSPSGFQERNRNIQFH